MIPRVDADVPVEISEGYFLYSDGKLFSKHSGRYLKYYTGPNGYPYYSFKDGSRGYIHRLMLTYFVRPPEVGEECDHIDHDRSNFNLDNLRWVSRSANIKHSYTQPSRGKPTSYRHPNTKLNDEQVVAIRNSKESELGLAREYGVSPRTIGHVRRYEKYLWVGKEGTVHATKN